MNMSFLISNPQELLEKLSLDLDDFNSDSQSSRYAINFCLTAYHLREWVWKFYFKSSPSTQIKIFSKEINKNEFEEEIYSLLPRFKLIRDLANGSKHFDVCTNAEVMGTDVTPTWDKDEAIWGLDECEWDYGGCRIHLKDGTTVNAQTLFNQVYSFWEQFIKCIN